ncbi:MAG: hypothetical protein Kow0042_21050 [Calditrichia bacterium]
MKDKKDFVSFLEDSHQFLSKKGDLRSETRLIKSSEVDRMKNIETIQWKSARETEPHVAVIERNGQIEAIKFKCSCGCTTVVQLEYPEVARDQNFN